MTSTVDILGESSNNKDAANRGDDVVDQWELFPMSTVVEEILEEDMIVVSKDGKVDEIAVVEKLIAAEECTSEGGDSVEVSVERLLDLEHRRHRFKVNKDEALLHILDEGALKFDETLLPNAEKPLDHLRGVYEHHTTGEPLDLELTIDEFIHQEPVTHHFAIELVLAIRINTRWRVAPNEAMTPKAILGLADLSWEEYSLYLPGAEVPLPADTPVKLKRGECFEAQRDGKYGEGNANGDN